MRSGQTLGNYNIVARGLLHFLKHSHINCCIHSAVIGTILCTLNQGLVMSIARESSTLVSLRDAVCIGFHNINSIIFINYMIPHHVGIL